MAPREQESPLGAQTGADGRDGDRYVTWSRYLDDLVVGANPWLSDVISTGDTWLVRVIVGEAKPGGANSSLASGFHGRSA